ncbi:beta-N-acetylhexosaminidase [Pukyongia salina]|uniref:beta-N-acetylhexosaminidase n=1 Tax=Pukyongia salina TaxID=2094025 RepID=A0A2S0HWI4_9FLAO|nr:beta-N-acetylhexosaminidase [Pukyongia salina]AVI50523.1 beta-N-acetylhexosaminidase [Pukyongia salina]
MKRTRPTLSPALVLLSIFFLLSGCNKKSNSHFVSEVNIIPAPQSIQHQDGSFIITEETTFSSSEEFKYANQFFQKYILNGTGISLKTIADPEKADIHFKTDTTLPAEGYRLTVSNNGILLEGADKAGVFYGVQTIRQILPPDMETAMVREKSTAEIPAVTITDAPRFAYRGMHLDVARHFFPKEFIKEYISYLAMLKMNYFHWHLTEDQGWRIEIEQFPRLTTHAAFRDETLLGHYNDTPQKFDGQRYGGFYSKEDIKEIIAYAEAHHITIVPEIEMPGHAQAAISAYPELGCSGEQVPVATKWGVFENIYCPNQKTFAFLKGVLTEVIELFPGEYIHIGGDEAPKTKWKQCAHCQKLIRDHGLKDEHELQSWFIKEIETFINSKGKSIIGWDEILEGGLAPNATVMSWRGTQGGIEAAKSGHKVIMTPTSHAYFDYYQSERTTEPLAIGGFLPLEKVYGFNPIPEELSPEEAKYVLGAQGNVWTEYMKTKQQVEYMIFPRMLAMSEVVWSGPTENFGEDFAHFVNRVESFHQRLEAMHVNYANHLYSIKGEVIKRKEGVYYKLSTPTSGKLIKYMLPNGNLTAYNEPFPIGGLRTQIKAMVYKDGQVVSDTFVEDITFHKGMFAKINLNTHPYKSYSSGGVEALNNGIKGSDSRYGDSEWLGFWGDDLEVTIELDTAQELSWISTSFFHAPGQWIYAPNQVTLLISKNGIDYQIDQTLDLNPDATRVNAILDIDTLTTKFIKLKIPNFGTIPDGKQGAGNKAWTFIDEIIIQ